MVVVMENSAAWCWGNLAYGLGGATVGEDFRTIGRLRLDKNIADPLAPDISEQSRVELVARLSLLWCLPSQWLKDAPSLKVFCD
jgi:hypothetical protein